MLLNQISAVFLVDCRMNWYSWPTQDTKAPKTALAREAGRQPSLKSSSKSSQASTQTQSWVARQVGPFHQHIRLRFSAITKRFNVLLKFRQSIFLIV